MLQIKKKATIKSLSYNLNFLFRLKSFKHEYMFKKKSPHTITLRSPKHFNIGKNKIVSINSKVVNLKLFLNKNMQSSAIFSNRPLWNTSTKFLLKNVYLLPKSVTAVIRTKFKFKWLGF